MVDVSQADQFLKDMSAARIAGDLDALMQTFHEDAQFRIVGVGGPATGKDAIRATLCDLIEQFEFLEWTQIRTFVNGDDVATHHRLKVKHRTSGQVADTETAEFLTMQDGKCRALVQYTDTALLFALSAIAR